jgi:hypothetical protein
MIDHGAKENLGASPQLECWNNEELNEIISLKSIFSPSRRIYEPEANLPTFPGPDLI